MFLDCALDFWKASRSKSKKLGSFCNYLTHSVDGGFISISSRALMQLDACEGVRAKSGHTIWIQRGRLDPQYIKQVSQTGPRI